MAETNDRSPSYPSHSLKEAVEKAEVLYKSEHRNPMAWALAMKHLGYKPKTGPGIVLLATLRKYGLIEYQGSGDSKLIVVSELAEQILHPGSPQRAKSLRDAALLPTIHQELWNSYRQSSDENLEYYLTTRKSFSEKAAKSLVREYRETIAFAELDSFVEEYRSEPESVGTARKGEAPVETKLTSFAGTAQSHDTYTVQIPLGVHKKATFEFPLPLTRAVWEKIKLRLESQLEDIIAEGEAQIGAQP